MPSDIVNRATITPMLRQFYKTLLQDDEVSPYFIRALGEDLQSEKWKTHLDTLDNFWLKMMTGKGAYGGHPFPPHAFLGEMYYETFARWLEVFHATVHQFFIPEIAEKFYKKSEILAAQFMDNLDIEQE